ncbi:Sporulation protein RMD8 [Escovopsis weberi]|uniref:Sporulation protein RMD8 n=1 Tax=Escovopsis weberi TaxID=150374 RepID=A0A0M8N127_ESCWE|nr:Sporulation protein RMD8 [Escovopsis weberi]
MSSAKQRPSVLVTDSRERADHARGLRRPGTSSGAVGRAPMRFMTVDNILQHSSQIPSGQPRRPPILAQRQGAAAAGPNLRRATSGGLPNIQSRTGQTLPSRTTKISEKLVLLPVTDDRDISDEEVESAIERNLDLQDQEAFPLRDEELDVLRKRGGIRGKSYAERLPKVQRTDKVSRLTAYCTAQAFKIKETAEFLRKKHEAKTKLYDDCLYIIYALPLMNGTDGCRVRSRPIMKTPGSSKTVLDLEIERSEQRDHYDGYFEDDAYTNPSSPPEMSHVQPPAFGDLAPASDDFLSRTYPFRHADVGPSPIHHRPGADAKNYAEMFVFSYGVVVFWNFTEHQEKDILADLTFADAEGQINLLARPLDQGDIETEEFHFEYSSDVRRPRIFNDMITLLPRSDHMIKLTISHAIAQSTKLCFFEEKMSETMLDAQHVPKTLALTGELGMTRTEIVRIMGRLFTSRVEINLSSNILDVPNFFWDSEPTLHPLYQAIREYLEIDPRIKVLNERCRVFLDLAEILSDSDADVKMSSITWIIIFLIILSIAVSSLEVGLRFRLLASNHGGEKDRTPGDAAANTTTSSSSSAAADVLWGPARTVPNMVVLAPKLSPDQKHSNADDFDFDDDYDFSGDEHEHEHDDDDGDSRRSDLEVLARALGIERTATLGDIKRGISALKRTSRQCSDEVD